MIKENKRKIMIKNFIIDLKKLVKFNFQETIRGYMALICLFIYKLYKNWEKRNFIKNNSQIPKTFFDKNEIIKVKPIPLKSINDMYMSNIINNSEESSEKFEIDLKHIPYNFPPLFSKNDKQINSTKEIQLEEYLKIKLAGIQSIDKEGKKFLQRLFDDKRKSFYVKFNNIQYNDTIEVYGWILFRNRYGFINSRYYNLNVILARNGFSKICKINTSDVYDEKIFYYMSDLIDSENEAKIRGLGIWRDKRSKIVSEYSMNRGSFFNVRKKIAEVFRLKNWQKIILKR